jgi:hypothetical protein
VQRENRPLNDHTTFCAAPRSEDQGLIEKLLSEFPVMGGRSAAEVALIEKGWRMESGGCDNLLWPKHLPDFPVTVRSKLLD